jgi:hypothetical protein
MVTSPKLEKTPTVIRRQDFRNLTRENEAKRVKLLKEKLRPNHITEGANDIRKICEEYVHILPGDSLTATTATDNSIPMPSIPKGRGIALRN